jgi:hypothetical protein
MRHQRREIWAGVREDRGWVETLKRDRDVATEHILTGLSASYCLELIDVLWQFNSCV